MKTINKGGYTVPSNNAEDLLARFLPRLYPHLSESEKQRLRGNPEIMAKLAEIQKEIDAIDVRLEQYFSSFSP